MLTIVSREAALGMRARNASLNSISTQVTIRGPYKQRGSYRTQNNEEMSSKSRSRKKAVYPSSGSWKTLETRKTEPSLCCAVPGLTHKLSAASNHSNKMANNFQVY